MKPFLILILVSLVCPGQPLTTPNPQTARVEGTIVDPLGKPLAQVQVRLTGPATTVNGFTGQPPIFAAETDSSGKFMIADVTPGSSYRLTAQRPRFLTASFGSSWIPANPISLTLRAGQTLSGITMTMTLQGVINGTVRDRNGAPVAGAMVVLMRQGFASGVRALQGVTPWGTGDLGGFRIVDIPPGRYFLQVVDRQGVPVAGSANAVTYYPSTTNPRAAMPIDVAVGAELRGIDIQMQRTPVYSIRGTLVDANNVPLGGVSGAVAPVSNPDRLIVAQFSRRQFQTRPDGTFVISGLAPDRYLVQASSGGLGTQLKGMVEVPLAARDVADLVVTMRPAVQLTGRVIYGSGDPASGLPGVLALIDGSNRGLAGYSAGIGTNGYFVLRDVVPSKYFLESRNLPEGVYIESVKAGREELLGSPLDLKSSVLLSIVVSNDAASVGGVVRNSQGIPLPGTVVSLWPVEPDNGVFLDGVRTFFADQIGEFRFSNLRPGSYYLAAWEKIEPGLAATRSFLSVFNDVATKVELGQGGRSAVELIPIPAAKLRVEEAKLP